LNLTSATGSPWRSTGASTAPASPSSAFSPSTTIRRFSTVGNPFLRPQFTNAYEVGFSRSWPEGTGSAAVHHRDVSDAFLRIFAIDDSNPNYDIVNRIFENAGNFRQTGVQLTTSHELVRAWRLTGSVNWFQNDIEAPDTILFFPTRRPFTLSASKDHTWDMTLNNRFLLPRGLELQANYIRYASRNVPQGRERARSSLDLSAKNPLMNDRAEFVFTFTDVFNDFALQHDIVGKGFTALYQNFLETQIATLAVRFRF
jgi:outer membrane cobalamin receptor